MIYRTYFTVIILLFGFVIASTAFAGDPPRRSATKVDDVFLPYNSETWIVSPDEESMGDEDVEDLPELDIYGIIAAYDNDYLRVDILLNKGVQFEKSTLYAIKFEYDNMNEYYTYYTDTKKLVYEKEKDGKIVKTKVLSMSDSKDVVGITDSGASINSDVYFIINKTDHIGGEKGKEYFLTTYFYSGYLDLNDKLQIADETMPVELQFEF